MAVKDITQEVNELRKLKEDMISHPPHYNSSPAHCECGRRIECIDVTRHLGFNIGNIFKYLWRYEHKDGLVALQKAQWYLNDLIKTEEMKMEISK